MLKTFILTDLRSKQRARSQELLVTPSESNTAPNANIERFTQFREVPAKSGQWFQLNRRHSVINVRR